MPPGPEPQALTLDAARPLWRRVLMLDSPPGPRLSGPASLPLPWGPALQAQPCPPGTVTQATLGPRLCQARPRARGHLPLPASLPSRFHSPARGPSLRTLTTDPSTFNTEPAPRDHPLLTMNSLPPGPTPPCPPWSTRSPNVATTGWERGRPVCLSGFSLPGLLDGCLLRDSSQHLAPPYAPLSSSQPLTSCDGRAHSLLHPCPPQPWACGPSHPKTQCSAGGLLDVPGPGWAEMF